MAEENNGDDTAAKLAELQARVDKLAGKNDELLGEVKAERDKRRQAEAAAKEAEDAARAKAEEAAAKSGDVESLRKQLETKHQAVLEAERARAEEVSGQLHRLVIDGGIRDALAKAQVAPQLAKGAALAFRDGRSIEVKDGAAWVDGVPLADAVTEWAASEDGSAYKAAGHASGGGAPGGGNSGGKPLSELGDAERLKLARAGKLKPLMGGA